jgi:hypothetical protein
VNEGSVKLIKFNQPTEKEIEKVLYNIMSEEERQTMSSKSAIDKFQIDDIKMKS